MFFLTFSFCDYPQQWQTLFQKPATTMMEGIVDLHHDIFTFIIIIMTFVTFMLGTILVRFIENGHSTKLVTRSTPSMKYFTAHGVTHHTMLETVWTIIPTVILLFIATPSFALIYALDEIVEPQVTVRVVGRQWYWTYEYPDTVSVKVPTIAQIKSFANSHLDSLPGLKTTEKNPLASALSETSTKVLVPHLLFLTPGFSFNSYLVETDDLFEGAFRLLEVTRRMVLPVLTNVRILVTSYDVIHSWAVPAFGVKVDALPGRLNEYFLNVNYLGIFYGQCSEICGVNHGFMPIKVQVVTEPQFRWWFFESSLAENAPLKFRDTWVVPPAVQKLNEQLRQISQGMLLLVQQGKQN